MTAPAGHVHVTEREGAHHWPDGRYDDAAWEDCTFMSGLELARVCHDLRIPATHAEGEALRADSGKPPGGGTNSSDLARALAKRYGFTSHARLAGFAALWAELSPGAAAESQGSMGAFPAGHPLRRWDPPFDGAHAVFIARMDDQPRVWWCDPLAPIAAGPRTKYTGEWVSKAELKAFVDGLGGTHVVARLVQETDMADFTVPANARLGTLTVSAAGHSYLRLVDGKLVPITALPFVKRALEIVLARPIPGGQAGADRRSAYLVGDQAAAILRSDGTFVADTAADPIVIEAAVTAALNKARANALAGAATAIEAAIEGARPT